MATHPPRGLERAVPAAPWLAVLGVVLAVSTLALTGWELEMRQVGLHAGDLGDGKADWTRERRKVDTDSPDTIAIVGDSRILFDTNLDTWRRLVGVRPVQLALPGTNARPFLHNLAEDERFKGLLLIGISETLFFRDRIGNNKDLLEYLETESPSQRAGQRIYVWLSRRLAFLDPDYTPLTLMERQRWPERVDPRDSPYYDVWKLSESYDDRQTAMWDRIEQPGFLREHARLAWNDFEGKPVAPEMIDKVIAAARADIEKIRARGGEVVWIRPPSVDPIRANERKRAPRTLVWDRLLRETHCIGIHFEDYPVMRHLDLPEYSHLSRADALRFTDAYVRVLRERLPRLAALARARGALSSPTLAFTATAAGASPAATGRDPP